MKIQCRFSSVYSLLVILMTLFSFGCASFRDVVPDGFDHEATKDTIILKIYEIKYDMGPSKNEYVDSKVYDILQDNCKNIFVESSRFYVLNDKYKGEYHNPNRYKTIVEVIPHIQLTQMPQNNASDNNVNRNVPYTVLFYRFVDPQTGLYTESFKIEGNAVLHKLPLAYGHISHFSQDDFYVVINASIGDALKKLKDKINERFPITGLVTNWEGGTLLVQGGTNVGMTSKDNYTLYYCRDNEPMTLLANLRGKIISRSESTMSIVCWNTNDDKARELKRRIMTGDRSLKGCLYVICIKRLGEGLEK